MKCAALTGISPEIIKDLKAGRPRTIELQSTHNIVTIAEVEPGPETHIFLTSIDLADLEPWRPRDLRICACHFHHDETDGGIFPWIAL